ncbi:MAG: phosphatidylserine/phosphatidylglycerophosphate/cardiolipin synthase family protein [Candidatus Dormibacteraeota bacterium]|nr:phosphatidylserine/phosphatidylglycerophosphate/cardiolipin synthase family protein [Candidatus Dormibacteraeota bacterium]
MPLLLLALLAASCAPGRTAPLTGAALALPAVVSGPIVIGADEFVPLPDGPTAFAAIAGELAHARRSIDLELYEFQRPDLAAMLLDAHDRGVTITAIKDPSERSSRSIWTQLAQGGVKVVAFPLERLTIDHVKLLIVDGMRAIVGGINWGTHSVKNHDFDMLATGPVVDNLERAFKQDMALAGEPAVIPSPAADRVVQVLTTHPGEGIRAAALAGIAAAHQSIDIEMFVLSDRLVLESLVSAARRAIHLRVLLDPTQPQNSAAFGLLQPAGAQVRFYRQSGNELLHAKLGIFDAGVVLFGSCNWSRSGFTRNHELDLLVADASVARVFLSRMDRDWAASAP